MGGSPTPVGTKRRKVAPIDIDDFKSLVDRVDTRFGHDPLVGELVGVLDNMIETLENHGKVYRHRKHQKAGATGFRNVSYHQHSDKYVGRIRYTDGRGVKQRKNTRYYTTAEEASIAVEELRAKLGLT
jgi:hypothetical protein